MKTTATDSIINTAALMLVAAQTDILRKMPLGLNDYYQGKRAAARFILRAHAKDYGRAGRRRVASAIRGWCEYFRADFRRAA